MVEHGVKEIVINIISQEKITVPAGTFNCFIAEPFSPQGKSLLKNNGEMKVWLSIDSLHLPIKIEQNTNIGIMLMSLKKYYYSK